MRHWNACSFTSSLTPSRRLRKGNYSAQVRRVGNATSCRCARPDRRPGGFVVRPARACRSSLCRALEASLATGALRLKVFFCVNWSLTWKTYVQLVTLTRELKTTRVAVAAFVNAVRRGDEWGPDEIIVYSATTKLASRRRFPGDRRRPQRADNDDV